MFLTNSLKLYELRLFADIWQAGCVIPFLCPCEENSLACPLLVHIKGSEDTLHPLLFIQSFNFHSIITIPMMGFKNLLLAAVALTPTALGQQIAWGQCKFWE